MSTILTWHGKTESTDVAQAALWLREIFAPNGEMKRLGDWEIGNYPISQSLNLPISHPPSPNLLFQADNLPTLAHLLANGFRGKVKLIYIDPPYQSGVKWQRKVRLRGPKAVTMQTTADHVFAAQTQYADQWHEAEYLQFIYERLPLLRQLLSEDGSLWLHCDHRQSHHLRCLLEEIFGAENFLNTVTWRSQTARGAKVSAFYFPASTHSIHIFAKNRSAPTVWNPPKRRIVLSETAAASEFMRDERGFFRTSDPGTYSFTSLKSLHAEGRLYAPFGGEIVIDEHAQRVYGSQGGNLAVKYYLQKVGRKRWQVERTVDNLWDDIPGLGTTPSEDWGYPTQKTEALLTRIIETASHTGDLVLDCFMGSGTTLAVAQKLGRRWIGIDQNRGALITTRRRLQGIGGSFALYQEEDGDRRLETGDQKLEIRDWEIGRLGDEQTAKVAQQTPVPLSSCHLVTLPSPHPVTLQITRIAHKPTTIEVQITSYESPAITALLLKRNKTTVTAWRELIDCIEIDPDYDGQLFCPILVDAPLKKSAQVQGHYSFTISPTPTKIAIRLTDVLGDETLLVETL